MIANNMQQPAHWYEAVWHDVARAPSGLSAALTATSTASPDAAPWQAVFFEFVMRKHARGLAPETALATSTPRVLGGAPGRLPLRCELPFSDCRPRAPRSTAYTATEAAHSTGEAGSQPVACCGERRRHGNPETELPPWMEAMLLERYPCSIWQRSHQSCFLKEDRACWREVEASNVSPDSRIWSCRYPELPWELGC